MERGIARNTYHAILSPQQVDGLGAKGAWGGAAGGGLPVTEGRGFDPGGGIGRPGGGGGGGPIKGSMDDMLYGVKLLIGGVGIAAGGGGGGIGGGQPGG